MDPIADLVMHQIEAGARALVLERFAYGGGDHRWYLCDHPGDFRTALSTAKPSSLLVILDGSHMAVTSASSLDVDILAAAGAVDGILLGTRDSDGWLRLDHLDGSELRDALRGYEDESILVAGPYPKRGLETGEPYVLTVPDADGIVRPHPH